MTRTLPTIVLLTTLAGCYRYTPVRPEAVPPESHVRLNLTERGQAQADSVLGGGSGPVDGRLTEWGQQVVLAVPVSMRAGTGRRTLERPVVVNRSEVVAVELRERDGLKTGLLIGGLSAAVVGGLVAAISGTFGGTSDGMPNEQPEGAVIPLKLRIGR